MITLQGTLPVESTAKLYNSFLGGSRVRAYSDHAFLGTYTRKDFPAGVEVRLRVGKATRIIVVPEPARKIHY